MEATEQDYQEYLSSHLHYRTFIRAFGAWRVETAAERNVLLLLVVNDKEQAVLKFVYDNLEERRRDVEMLRRIPPDDDTGPGGAGVLARLRPVPPAPAAGNAKPKPGLDDAPT